MSDSRIRNAALNNAEWCDAIASAHGAPGEFHDGIWIVQRPMPRYYPNVVTLHETIHHDQSHAIDRIRDLASAGLPATWAVKDSFEMLDLSSSGFTKLFDGQWIWRAAGAPPSTGSAPAWHWTVINHAHALTEWESAWSTASGEASGQPRIFVPALLDNRTIAVIAARDGEQIVAGAIANRSEEVVGVTNLFAPPRDALAATAGVLTMLAELFPKLPVVGWENGGSLENAVRLGYQRLGPLRVWARAV